MTTTDVLFYINDIYSVVLRTTKQAKSVMRKICRARPKGYEYMPRYRAGMWDGYISLLKCTSGKTLVPSGLLPDVIIALKNAGITTSFFYDENKPSHDNNIDVDILEGAVLRDYQQRAAVSLLERSRGIAKMATNAGKTYVFAALLRKLKLPSLVIVQSLDLLYQTSERLAQYLDSDVGMIGDGNFSLGDYTTVATIQTLNSWYDRHPKKFRELSARNQVLVIDECHHVAHNKTFDILMSVGGWYRWGFSGTPLDRGMLNDLKLIACTGPVRTEISNAELISNGLSSVPMVYIHDMDETSDEDAWDFDYHSAYVCCIVENKTRNCKVVQLSHDYVASEKSVLVIVKWVRHGKVLYRMLQQAGVNSRFVSGSSSKEERQSALHGMATGVPVAVIATPIFDEGVDLPALDSIILACGGASTIKLLQRIGRGLRIKPDASRNVEIHDFLDSDNEYLLNHSDTRVGVYEQEGFQYKYVDCVM